MVDLWDADKQNVEGADCCASADKSRTRCRLVNNTEEGGKYVWEPVALSTKVIYVDAVGHAAYTWNGPAMQQISQPLKRGRTSDTAFPGDSGAALENSVSLLKMRSALVPFVNVNVIKQQNYTLELAISTLCSHTGLSSAYGDVRVYGMLITYRKDASHWEIKQYCGPSIDDDDFRNTDNWKNVGSGGSATVFNPTVEYPISGYYTLYDPDNAAASAVDAALKAGRASLGLLLTIQVSKKIWKTYQYIGSTLDKWQDVSYWQDFGSLAAGSENYININNLIDGNAPVVYYTLSSAVAGLLKFHENNSVSYIKRGLIISFLSGPHKIQSYQFHGANINDA